MSDYQPRHGRAMRPRTRTLWLILGYVAAAGGIYTGIIGQNLPAFAFVGVGFLGLIEASKENKK